MRFTGTTKKPDTGFKPRKKPPVTRLEDEIKAGRMRIVTDPAERKALENKERKEIGHRTHTTDGQGTNEDCKYADNTYTVLGDY